MTTSYEPVAKEFMQVRNSEIGVSEIEDWLIQFSAGDKLLDLGCGHGYPLGKLLQQSGLQVFGIDVSPTLAEEYKRNFPKATVACESVVDSALFSHQFDGVLAWGLLFLLTEKEQIQTLNNVAGAVREGGRLLFTSPSVRAEWEDILTNTTSVSLGAEAYREILTDLGFEVQSEYDGSGNSHYYDAVKLESL